MAKINTIFSMTDNVTNPLRRMQGELEKTSSGFKDMAIKIMGVNQAVQLVGTAVNTFKKACNVMNELVAVYNVQAEQEVKLATVMKQRMNATQADIQLIKDLASAQQRLGIYSDEVVLSGAQELATFVSNRQALETLIPAMSDLIAQQKGYNATVQDFQSIGDMMGKVMGGQVSALSRIGYVFSEEEKQLLQTGDEMQRASTLAKIITDNVGHMNQALAGTDAGAIRNSVNALGDMNERLGKSLQPLQRAFKEIKTNVMLYFEKPLMQAIEWVKKNIGTLTSMVIRLGTVVTVVGTAMAVAWAIANWPLTLTIALITTLLRVMFDITRSANEASEAMNGFGNQCAQAGAMFGYVVGFIGAVIGGAMNIIYNVVATVYNALETIVEFLFNVFTHPIKAIEGLFINLATTIINILESVASVFDYVFGTSWQNSLAKASNALQQFKKDNVATNGYMTGVAGKAGLLELKEATGIVQGTLSAGNIGRDLGRILDEKFAMPKFDLPEQQFKTDSSGALVVSDKNLVDIAEDYRDLLSKRAIEKFNLQYKNVTPQVNIDHMEIHQEADAEKVVSMISDGINELANSDLRSYS